METGGKQISAVHGIMFKRGFNVKFHSQVLRHSIKKKIQTLPLISST